MAHQHSYATALQHLDKTQLALAGGKGAGLGELHRIESIRVPAGFCVTTRAFKEIMAQSPSIEEPLAALSAVGIEDQDRIVELSGRLRSVIEDIAIPKAMEAEITGCLSGYRSDTAFAIRSSATAEDLPTASFAGQQDTYLNIIGKDAILRHIARCWASLFTVRAITYRMQQGFDHRKVQLAVVVQQMIAPYASGILFTADPVTGHRKTSSIDAGLGLGEALVSGRINPENYTVRNGIIIEKKRSAQRLVIEALPTGGTQERQIDPEQRHTPALTDEQVLRLDRIGRKIEAHFGCPQDIEWCLTGDEFYIVQSRPITTLFPIPASNDQQQHIFVSVGHPQMMTDAMRPLGLSIWQMTAARPFYVAAGRMFVDVAKELASPGREKTLHALFKSDPLVKDALMTIVQRGDLLPSSDAAPAVTAQNHKAAPPVDFQALDDYDPAIVAELIADRQASIAALRQTMQSKQGPAVFESIREDMQQLHNSRSDRRSLGVIITAMNASYWLNDNLKAWLGEVNVADTLTLSAPNNITSEMGLDLLDVADVIRPYPEVIAYLQQTKDDNFLDELQQLPGGPEARQAIKNYLDRYGMRCTGEIDITRTRWAEKPLALAPVILGHIRNFEPGAAQRKFEQGRQQAQQKEQDILRRLRQLPGGEQKARDTKRMIDLVRNLIGYREYPKYDIVSRYWIYKQALLQEAQQLVQAGVLQEKEDSYYLEFEELSEAVRTHSVDQQLISQRKESYKQYEKLIPPRVITSEGEIITGSYKRDDLPAGALVGLPVSTGVVEGRACVVTNMENAHLQPGDILVTTFTDPSWTPLFVSIKGLVAEVGGLMSHGAVIAREYGLPAVVGVEQATTHIRDGQQVRVNGTEGYIELL